MRRHLQSGNLAPTMSMYYDVRQQRPIAVSLISRMGLVTFLAAQARQGTFSCFGSAQRNAKKRVRVTSLTYQANQRALVINSRPLLPAHR
jgi:hypothetical protein